MEAGVMIKESFANIPSIEGPIKVTEKSHPFCAMEYSRTPLKLEEYAGSIGYNYLVSINDKPVGAVMDDLERQFDL